MSKAAAPRIAIRYCTQCHWLLRAASMAQEQSWSRSSEQDSAKAKWTAAGVGPLQFRATGRDGGRA